MDFVTPFFEWLLQCEYVRNNKIFANAIEMGINRIEVVTEQINESETVEYVDGSKLIKIRFNVFDFKSLSFQNLVQTMIEKNENIENLLDTQKICDFVRSANENENFPDFGTGYEVQKVYSMFRTPSAPTIDHTADVMRYSIPIVCEVVENGTHIY